MSIILNDNLGIQAPKPADERYGPYASVPDALVAVVEARRYQGLRIGVLVGGQLQDYWFKDGIGDGNLVTYGGAAPVDVGLAQSYAQIGDVDQGTAVRIVAPNADGDDVSLARVRTDGVIESQGLNAAGPVTASSLVVDGSPVTGIDYGAEGYDAIGDMLSGIYYVDNDYRILKYSPYEPEIGGGGFAAAAEASAVAAAGSAAAASASAGTATSAAAAASASADAAAASAMSGGAGGLAQSYVQIGTQEATAFRFVATDANGIDRSLGRICDDGIFESPGVSTGPITASSLTVNGNTITGEDYGAEVFDVIGGCDSGIYYVDRDYQILKFTTYEAETGGGGGAPSGIPADDIRTFSPDIDLTGATDMSVQLKAAHDAAALAGYRHMFIEGPILAPTALALGDVMFLSRSGKGRLIGTYTKRVTAVGTSSAPSWSRISPERHLKRLRTKLETATAIDPAIVTWVSDSVGTKADATGWGSSLEGSLRRAFSRQYGPDADKIRIVSRGIGGTQWVDLDRATVNVVPNQAGVQWITTTAPWLDYVQTIEQPDLTPTARTPDVVMFFFGMNHVVPLTPTTMAQARSAIAEVESWTPKPDIIFITHMVPSVMSTLGSRGTKSGQEGRRSLSGWARHYAAYRGFGLIDLGRTQDCELFGFDPWQTYWRNLNMTVTGGTTTATVNIFGALTPVETDGTKGITQISIPWTAPEAVYDYGLTFFPSGPSLNADVFWASPRTVTFTLSPVTGNVLILRRDPATLRLEYTVLAATGITSIPWTLTNSKQITGSVNKDFEVSVRGETLIIAYDKMVIVDRPIDRSGGEFTPTITLDSGTGQFTYRDLLVGAPMPVMPSMTDPEAWGERQGLSGIGGSGDNHPSEIGIAAIIDKTIQSTRFA